MKKTGLNTVLTQCYGSIRMTEGELYRISSYNGLRAGLNCYINTPLDRCSWNLLHDPQFSQSANNFVKSVVKEIRRAGKGKTTHHPLISSEDQYILKYSAALNPDNPKGMKWCDIQLHFGRRSREGKFQSGYENRCRQT